MEKPEANNQKCRACGYENIYPDAACGGCGVRPTEALRTQITELTEQLKVELAKKTNPLMQMIDGVMTVVPEGQLIELKKANARWEKLKRFIKGHSLLTNGDYILREMTALEAEQE